MADSGRILPVALGWKTGSPLHDPDMRSRRRLRIDGDSDDGSTSNDSSSSGDTASSPSSIRPCTASSVGARPIISMSVSAANAMNKTSKTKRRTSIDSLLSDSSSSIEGYLKTLKISEDRVAAQAPATFNMPDSSDDEEDVEDPISAWVRESHSKDYILSSKKRSLSKWPDLRLPRTLYRQLFDFQRHGVQWMAGLHSEGIGGILGDDMGMGKTYVTLAYLGGLMRAGSIRNALVVAPLSVLQSWRKEAQKILPQCVSSIRITVLHDMSRAKRLDFIKSLSRNGSTSQEYNLAITTYGHVRSSTNDFCSNSTMIWDYVVLDEGHQVKNSVTETSVACRKICSPGTRRLLLTGTPILNNLNELWSLFDFATSGRVLGSSREFKRYYGRNIEDAREKGAHQSVMELGSRKNKELQEVIRPYFLQRLKIDFLQDKLPQKHDMVVWTGLSDEQRAMYTEFVESKDSLAAQAREGYLKSPLLAITWLKKLCGHPRLTDKTGEGANLQCMSVDNVLSQSAKLVVLVDLVQSLKEEGHRPLIFSQSTKMLDVIAFVLRHRAVLSRIDGRTPGKDRQRLVDDFNQEDSQYDVMLLSTKAAGCGLTLTGADTAIVYDPSWTPAEDAQAVDRCYRIGQEKEVTVYRLIAAGTVEEKMYEKQIHKDGIRRTVLSQDQNIERYFNKQELRALFTLGPKGECKKAMRDINRARYQSVLDMNGVVGLSRHDGFYETTNEKQSTGFDGTAPISPKILGKAARVMARQTAREMLPGEGVEPPSSHPASTATSKAMKIKKEPRGEDNTKSLGNNFHTEKDPLDNAVTRLLRSTRYMEDRGLHRRALKHLLDAVETQGDHMKGAQKIEVHRRIATISTILGLL